MTVVPSTSGGPHREPGRGVYRNANARTTASAATDFAIEDAALPFRRVPNGTDNAVKMAGRCPIVWVRATPATGSAWRGVAGRASRTRSAQRRSALGPPCATAPVRSWGGAVVFSKPRTSTGPCRNCLSRLSPPRERAHRRRSGLHMAISVKGQRRGMNIVRLSRGAVFPHIRRLRFTLIN
jgi:hypothetical protein